MTRENTWWYHPHALHKNNEVLVIPDPHPILSQHQRTGQRGTIVDFTDKSICRWWEPHSGNKAGLYENLEYPIVQFSDGSSQYVRANLLEVADQTAYQTRVKQLLEQYPPDSIGPGLLGAYISPLPEDWIWEGDVVRLREGAKHPTIAKAGWVLDNKDSFLVSWLCFRVPDKVVESRNQPPSFSLANKFRMGMEDGWSEDELELVARGNFWREAHGESLYFPTNEERASFLCDTARVEFVKNSQGDRTWYRLHDAITQVSLGQGHGVLKIKGWEDDYYNVVKFQDDFFGRLIFHMTLDEGFLIPTHHDE